MIAVAAVSRDGYMATGQNDGLAWTGAADKTVFRLLSHTHPDVVVGRNTAVVMPHTLQGRRLIAVGRRTMMQPESTFDLPRNRFFEDPPLFEKQPRAIRLPRLEELRDTGHPSLPGFELSRCTLAGGPELLQSAFDLGLIQRLFVVTVPISLQRGLQLPSPHHYFNLADEFFFPPQPESRLRISVYNQRI